MDVPFLSSGAMSRVHYSLIRKVEAASSAQAADQILLSEIQVIQRTLEKPHLSTKACKESLILLLYCAMALATTSPGDLNFAFRHAINLAEQGQSVLDKRIGYTFCTELMPPNHELQLMLVNTLRKDLESASVGRICLAMDVLMQMPNEDVAPAVHTRLRSLFHDTNDLVRRRAYMVYFVLFGKDPDQLQQLEELLAHANQSSAAGVVKPALLVASKLESQPLGTLLNSRLRQDLSGNVALVHAILRALRNGKTSLDPENIPLVLDVIKRSSDPPNQALVDAFLMLSTVPLDAICQSQVELGYSPATSIRHLLTSGDPNEQYIFIFCLSCLDPSTWAGNFSGNAAVFDEWEVQQIVKLLDSRDDLIRKMTLKVLFSVDPGIITAYYSQLVRQMPLGLPVTVKGEHVSRLLDIIEIQCQEDVEQYARHLKELFATVEGKERALPVLDICVEQILNRARDMDPASRVSFVTALATFVADLDVHIGSTLMVVICALVCEHCGKISTSPLEIIQGIATKLSIFTPSVQDACLLCMLRLSAECDKIPHDVYTAVQELSRSAGRHIRRRCDQFLILSLQRHVVNDIVSRAASTSLPDFVSTLTNYQTDSVGMSPSQLLALDSPRRTPPGSGTTSRKLRYDAYASPQPVPSLQRPLKAVGASPSPRDFTPGGELAHMETPGKMMLLATKDSLDSVQVDRVSHHLDKVGLHEDKEDKTLELDLIALDSSSTADHADSSSETGFEEMWNSMEDSNVRGWCEVSIDTIVRLLQSLQLRMRVTPVDQAPFEGELKVLVIGPSGGRCAALRLRDGDDESCLWRLRCNDLELRTTIKRLLEGI